MPSHCPGLNDYALLGQDRTGVGVFKRASPSIRHCPNEWPLSSIVGEGLNDRLGARFGRHECTDRCAPALISETSAVLGEEGRLLGRRNPTQHRVAVGKAAKAADQLAMADRLI